MPENLNQGPRTPTAWMILALLGGALIVVFTSAFREPLWNQNDFLDLLLGSITNFVHAALLFPFTILNARELILRMSPKAGNEANLNRWFYIGIGCSLLFITLVEVVQLDSFGWIDGTFDTNDIVATLISPLLSIPLFRFFKPGYLKRFEN